MQKMTLIHKKNQRNCNATTIIFVLLLIQNRVNVQQSSHLQLFCLSGPIGPLKSSDSGGFTDQLRHQLPVKKPDYSYFSIYQFMLQYLFSEIISSPHMYFSIFPLRLFPVYLTCLTNKNILPPINFEFLQILTLLAYIF